MKIKKLLFLVFGLIAIFTISGCKGSKAVSIEVDSSNAVVEFTVYDDFSFDGLKVIVNYEDGSQKEVSEFEVDSTSFKKGTLGTYDILVTYQDGKLTLQTTYKVKVAVPSVKGITVDTSKAKTVFYLGEEFNYDGLIVMANYGSYTEEITNYSVTCRGFDKSTPGSYSVTVDYKDGAMSHKAYYTVKVSDKFEGINKLIGLDVYFNDQEAVFKTVSVLDETKYDFSDVVVEAIYADGTTKELSSEDYEMNISNVDLNKRGIYEVVIRYQEVYDFSSIGQENVTITEENFFLILVENKVESIEFVSGKTSFTAEEEAGAEDWIFEATLENGDKEILTHEDVKIDSFPFISGTYNLNVTYRQEQLTEGYDDVVVTDSVEIVIAEPIEEGGIKTYQFAASQISCEGVTDKNPIAAGTAFARGYFVVFGTVTQRLNSAATATSSVEVAKGGQGGIQFTVSGTAEVTLSMGSTGGSNTSAVGIVDSANNLVSNKEGITHAVGTGETIMTYTLTSGIYKVISPSDATYDRAARLYSLIVVQTPSEDGEEINNYFFDSATITVEVGQEDKTPLPEGTSFLGGYFKTFGAVVQRLNSTLSATAYVEVGSDESSGISFTISGTAEVVINVSSTGGTNASSIGIIDDEGNAMINDQNITVVEGTGVVALTYKLEAGTYSVVSLNDIDETRDRGARVYTISVLETKKGA